MLTEPKWKSYIVQTMQPIFTPEQCKMVIEAGREEPRNDAGVGTGKIGNTDKGIKGGTVDSNVRTSHISWIPFKKMTDMYIDCLLYTSPSPRDGLLSRMPSSA